MRRLAKTVDSEQDIRRIVAYIARDSARAAQRWLDELEKELDLLVRFPGLGPRREDLPGDLRSLPFGKYMIYYQALRDGILVISVLHGAMDTDDAFPQEP